MTVANPQTRAKEIENLIASNELNIATKRLMDFVTDFSTNRKRIREVIGIRQQYNSLCEYKRVYGETHEFYNREIRKLIEQMLEFMDCIIDEYNEANQLSSKLKDKVLRQEESTAQISNSDSEQLNKTNKQKTNYERAKEIFLRKKRDSSISTKLVFKGEGIAKTYKSRAVKFTLHPIDIELKLGEITAVVGENGNGKTTLLRIVAGDLAINSGDLSYPLLTLNSKTDWYSIKQQLAYIPQELPKWYGLLMDNLHFTASIHGIKGQDNEDEVNFIISRLGLEKYKKAKWNEISSGYKTRFSLARALVWKPKLLILDEPLANLDINAQVIFLQDLRDLANSSASPLSVIVSSQHLYAVESIADNIIFLKDGNAIYQGSVKEFSKNRDKNLYEIACELSQEELINLLKPIYYYRVEKASNNFIIYTSTEITSADVLRVFVEHDVSLKYFKDISQSTRKLFEEEP